jgi:hypothetical protein
MLNANETQNPSRAPQLVAVFVVVHNTGDERRAFTELSVYDTEAEAAANRYKGWAQVACPVHEMWATFKDGKLRELLLPVSMAGPTAQNINIADCTR